jgi:phage/plasmid-associated DNA primase
LVGKDKIQTCGLHKDAIEFVYFGGIQINCNALPLLTDWSFGMRRRIRVVPYEFTFTPNPDPANPMERASAPEAEADADGPSAMHALLFGVLIAVYRASDRRAFPPPQKVEYASNQYSTSSNPVALFIEEKLMRGGPDDFVLVPAVYEAWRASVHGKEAKVGATPSGFGKILPKEFVSLPVRHEGKAGSTRVYYGWRFLPHIVHPVDAIGARAAAA